MEPQNPEQNISPEPVVASQVFDPEAQTRRGDPLQTPNKNKWLMIGGAVLVAILAAGVAVLGYQNFKVGQQTPAPTPTTASALPPAPPPVPGEPTNDETTNWKTYTNAKYRFTVNYSPSWHLFESSLTEIRLSPELRDGEVPTVGINIYNNPSLVSLKSWWENDIKKYADYQSLLKQTIQEEKLINGYSAFFVQTTPEWQSRPFTSIYINRDEEIYLISATFTSGGNYQAFNQILSTFKFSE